jgi:hypothetical protein
MHKPYFLFHRVCFGQTILSTLMRRYYPLTCDSISLSKNYLLVVNMLLPYKVSYILYGGPSGSPARRFDCCSPCSVVKNYDKHNPVNKQHNVSNISRSKIITELMMKTLKSLNILLLYQRKFSKYECQTVLQLNKHV